MNDFHRLIAWFMIAAFTCAVAAPALAQAPKAQKPVKKLGATPSTVEDEVSPEEPAVAAILATKPTTPSESMRAAKTLADLSHPDLAKRFLKQVLDAKLDPQRLADLGVEFGAPLFLDLSGKKDLQPEAKQLADAVLAALALKLEDAKRIAGLIAQLQDPAAEKRVQALTDLQDVRRAAIGPLIRVLADPARTAEYANVRTALAGMGRPARDALVAVLDVADAKLKFQAIATLVEMNHPKVAIDLIELALSEKNDPDVRMAAADALKQFSGQVPARADAIRTLGDAAKTYFEQRPPVEGVADGQVELWRWDASINAPVTHIGTPADAARHLAARYAHAAHTLAPEDSQSRLLYLATMLDAAAYANGLDRPLADNDPAMTTAKPFGVKTLDEVLAYAMAHGHPAAATAAARLLGQIGKVDELLYRGDKPAPLVQALQSPDRRLRMAALDAIVALKPTKPYAGSSQVPAALSFFAASSGIRHALVGGPVTSRARDLASVLAAAGFETDTAGSGKELLRLATQSPDYELVWIDVGIERPEIALLMQELRRDPRTSLLRVGLLARAGHYDRAEHVAATDAMAKNFAQPHDENAYRWQMEQLATLAPQEFVGFDERQRQAARSLELLAELSRTSSKLYDLRRAQGAVLAAMYNPKLGTKAVAVLAGLNSAESQQALVEVASRFTLPLDLRKAAAQAFRENTQKHGILLTTDEIRRQYRRYNESEKLDAPTRHVLGLILDCLEAPTKQ